MYIWKQWFPLLEMEQYPVSWWEFPCLETSNSYLASTSAQTFFFLVFENSQGHCEIKKKQTPRKGKCIRKLIGSQNKNKLYKIYLRLRLHLASCTVENATVTHHFPEGVVCSVRVKVAAFSIPGLQSFFSFLSLMPICIQSDFFFFFNSSPFFSTSPCKSLF